MNNIKIFMGVWVRNSAQFLFLLFMMILNVSTARFNKKIWPKKCTQNNISEYTNIILKIILYFFGKTIDKCTVWMWSVLHFTATIIWESGLLFFFILLYKQIFYSCDNKPHKKSAFIIFMFFKCNNSSRRTTLEKTTKYQNKTKLFIHTLHYT